MIDEFNKYVANYDRNLDGIERKYKHSIRVMEKCIKYAKMLDFDEEDIELAGIIGLLHDIGRFDQYKKYQNYNDLETFDHADYGVKLLFDDGLISRFSDRVNDYDLIRFAIKNHNKLSIEECNNERYIRFTKLIRDMDKLDIVYLSGYLNEYNNGLCDEELSKNVVDDIMNHRQVDSRNVRNENDHSAMVFGLVFDINNDISLDELKRNYYYYYRNKNNMGIFDRIYHEVVRYIDERMRRNVG